MKAASSPLSITEPADVTATLRGHRSGHVALTVKDSGTARLHITVTAGDFGPDAHAGSWITGISPAAFTLRPGHSKTVTVTVRMPATASGPGIADIKWTAAPAAAGDMRVGISTVTAVKLVHPGQAVPIGHVPPMVLPASHSGTPDTLIAGALGAVLVLAAILGAVLGWRRRRHRPRRVIAHTVSPASQNGGRRRAGSHKRVA